jgi:hypothetical protein
MKRGGIVVGRRRRRSEQSSFSDESDQLEWLRPIRTSILTSGTGKPGSRAKGTSRGTVCRARMPMSLISRHQHKLTAPLRQVPLVALYTMSHAPPDWKARAPRPLPNTLTFSQQDTLPRLPVPELAATLAKVETSLRPLAHSMVELETARKKIIALGEPEGFGRTLHQRLLAHAKHPKHINWLEEFWDDASFILRYIASTR